MYFEIQSSWLISLAPSGCAQLMLEAKQAQTERGERRTWLGVGVRVGGGGAGTKKAMLVFNSYISYLTATSDVFFINVK